MFTQTVIVQVTLKIVAWGRVLKPMEKWMKSLFKVTLLATTMAIALNATQVMAAEATAPAAAATAPAARAKKCQRATWRPG